MTPKRNIEPLGRRLFPFNLCSRPRKAKTRLMGATFALISMFPVVVFRRLCRIHGRPTSSLLFFLFLSFPFYDANALKKIQCTAQPLMPRADHHAESQPTYVYLPGFCSQTQPNPPPSDKINPSPLNPNLSLTGAAGEPLDATRLTQSSLSGGENRRKHGTPALHTNTPEHLTGPMVVTRCRSRPNPSGRPTYADVALEKPSHPHPSRTLSTRTNRGRTRTGGTQVVVAPPRLLDAVVCGTRSPQRRPLRPLGAHSSSSSSSSPPPLPRLRPRLRPLANKDGGGSASPRELPRQGATHATCVGAAAAVLFAHARRCQGPPLSGVRLGRARGGLGARRDWLGCSSWVGEVIGLVEGCACEHGTSTGWLQQLTATAGQRGTRQDLRVVSEQNTPEASVTRRSTLC